MKLPWQPNLESEAEQAGWQESKIEGSEMRGESSMRIMRGDCALTQPI